MNGRFYATFLAIFLIQSCSGGVTSDLKGEHRTLQPKKLPAPQDMNLEKEELLIDDSGVSVQTVRFKKASKLRIGEVSELGLAPQEIVIPAGRTATVISRLSGADKNEFLYVALHDSVEASSKGTDGKSATVQVGVKISEGYVSKDDVEEIDESKVSPTLDYPKISTDTTPPATPATCSVSLILPQTVNRKFIKAQKLQVLSGPVFRSQSMEDFYAVVTFGKDVTKSSVGSVKVRMELGEVVQGIKPKTQLDDCEAMPANAGAANVRNREVSLSGFNTCKRMPELLLAGDKLALADNVSVKASFKDLKFTPNNWMGSKINVTAKAYVASQDITCTPTALQLASPLVLDFSGRSEMETLSLLDSNVQFDLLGNGQSVRTGWIQSRDQAFIVMDLNKNGKIDDGRELFGDGTLLANGRAAANGFDALAQYDSNGDGRIDHKDRSFKRLKLWFDANQDGKTDAGELRSLASEKVHEISLSYKPSEQSKHGGLMNNKILYESAFKGPASCGAQGCKIYDVYFGTLMQGAIVSQ